MAMTKAETKRMSDLEDALARARAMRWPEYPAPAPMTEPEIKANLIDGGVKYGRIPQRVARGWFAWVTSYGEGRTGYGCSDGINHSAEGDVTTTQGKGRMFATEVEALRFLRHEMTERFSLSLAKIDAKIAERRP